jgi:nitroreductase/dihydropteridine reductase
MDSTAFHDFAKNQAFISLGFALSAAAVMKVGSCPMTGFQPKELKKILQLPEFEDPVAIMAVGHAPEDDSPKANPFPKYRFAMDYLVKYHT